MMVAVDFLESEDLRRADQLFDIDTLLFAEITVNFTTVEESV